MLFCTLCGQFSIDLWGSLMIQCILYTVNLTKLGSITKALIFQGKNLWKKNKGQMAWRVLLSKQLLFLAPCQHCLEDWRLRLKYESDDILMDFLLNFLPNHNWIFHFIRLAHTKCFPVIEFSIKFVLLSPNPLLYFCEQVQVVKLDFINFVTVTLNLLSQEVLTRA